MWVTMCAVFAVRGWQGEGKIKVAILPDLTVLPSDLSDCTQRRTYRRAWLPGPCRHRFLRTQESKIILYQYFWSLLRNLVTELPPWSSKQLLPASTLLLVLFPVDWVSMMPCKSYSTSSESSTTSSHTWHIQLTLFCFESPLHRMMSSASVQSNSLKSRIISAYWSRWFWVVYHYNFLYTIAYDFWIRNSKMEAYFGVLESPLNCVRETITIAQNQFSSYTVLNADRWRF